MDFRAIEKAGGKKFVIAGNIYPVPQGATHIYLRNGQLLFGFSLSPDGDKKTNKGRFLKIPGSCKAVSFSEYTFKVGGHHYGEPQWHV